MPLASQRVYRRTSWLQCHLCKWTLTRRASASSLHGLLGTALGAKPAEPKVHIDVSAKLADINLDGLEFEVMPDGAAVDDLAAKFAVSKKKGIASPFSR